MLCFAGRGGVSSGAPTPLERFNLKPGTAECSRAYVFAARRDRLSLRVGYQQGYQSTAEQS
jgi:hypothetical protein